MSSGEQKRLIENIVSTLKEVPKEIEEKMVSHFYKADKAYGEGVSKGTCSVFSFS